MPLLHRFGPPWNHAVLGEAVEKLTRRRQWNIQHSNIRRRGASSSPGHSELYGAGPSGPRRSSASSPRASPSPAHASPPCSQTNAGCSPTASRAPGSSRGSPLVLTDVVGGRPRATILPINPINPMNPMNPMNPIINHQSIPLPSLRVLDALLDQHLAHRRHHPAPRRRRAPEVRTAVPVFVDDFDADLVGILVAIVAGA